jgi:hypothetical protein
VAAPSPGTGLRLEQDYPVALERLWQLLGRRDYVERKYAALGAPSFRLLRFEAGDRGIEVEHERGVSIAPDALPGWARPFAGRVGALVQRSRWRRAGAGRAEVRIEVRLAGLPLRAECRGEAVELSPTLTRLTLDFALRGGLPLGGRIARLFADQVRHALAQDHAFTVAYLAAADRDRS